jgi:hypothetical protein
MSVAEAGKASRGGACVHPPAPLWRRIRFAHDATRRPWSGPTRYPRTARSNLPRSVFVKRDCVPLVRVSRSRALYRVAGESVMLGHYVNEEDEHLRARSNRTFTRLAAGLPLPVASCYAYEPAQTDLLANRIAAAKAGDLDEVGLLLAKARKIQDRRVPAAG